MSILSQCIVVVRSSYERTEIACYQSIISQGIDEQNIKFAHETPFFKSLERSFEIGIESKKDWLVCVDADVILKKDVIRRLLIKAAKFDSKIFEFQTYVLDYLFGGPRVGGIHLYRCDLLPKALEMLTECSEELRPEACIIRKMNSVGFSFKQTKILIGLHDYQQDYDDLYRKAYFHTIKHDYLKEYFKNFWVNESGDDTDFEVALLGLRDADAANNSLYFATTKSTSFDKFKQYNYSRKSKICKDEQWTQYTVKKINEWYPSELYSKKFPDMAGYLDFFDTDGLKNIIYLYPKKIRTPQLISVFIRSIIRLMKI